MLPHREKTAVWAFTFISPQVPIPGKLSFFLMIRRLFVKKYSSTMRVLVSFKVREYPISSSRLKTKKALQLG